MHPRYQAVFSLEDARYRPTQDITEFELHSWPDTANWWNEHQLHFEIRQIIVSVSFCRFELWFCRVLPFVLCPSNL